MLDVQLINTNKIIPKSRAWGSQSNPTSLFQMTEKSGGGRHSSHKQGGGLRGSTFQAEGTQGQMTCSQDKPDAIPGSGEWVFFLRELEEVARD